MNAVTCGTAGRTAPFIGTAPGQPASRALAMPAAGAASLDPGMEPVTSPREAPVSAPQGEGAM
jgi:hypothetical protein